jgi:ribosomal protein S18 acetylase RimI-like enzyme
MMTSGNLFLSSGDTKLFCGSVPRKAPMINIRFATSDDARAIAHIQVETWRLAYRDIVDDKFLDTFSEDDRTDRWTEIMTRPEQTTFVAEVEGHGVVGFANGGSERNGREDFRGELCGLYVLPNWHRQGIGRRLVVTFGRWLMDSCFDTMMVWVLADNPCRRFYEGLGGRLVGEQEIRIGEQVLDEVAYGWDDVTVLTGNRDAGASTRPFRTGAVRNPGSIEGRPGSPCPD